MPAPGGSSHLVRDRPAWAAELGSSKELLVGPVVREQAGWGREVAEEPGDRIEQTLSSVSSERTTVNGDIGQDTVRASAELSSSWGSRANHIEALREEQGVTCTWEEDGFFACPVCAAAVPLSWNLEDHLATFAPLLGEDLECDLCGKRFIEHRALKQHRNFCVLARKTSSS